MKSRDFNEIPVWGGDGSQFEILLDDIDGRIPVARVESLEEFESFLDSVHINGQIIQPGQPEPRFRQLIFRGQRRHDWPLMSSLARVAEQGMLNQRLVDRQFDYFRKHVRGRLSDYAVVQDGQEDELWAIGQHHGLNTPLLDWTYSPYVALFFAFIEDDKTDEADNEYRAIYMLDKDIVADDDICPEVRIVEPRRDEYGRLVNQAGLFTFSPIGSTIEAELANSLAHEDFFDSELRDAAEDSQAAIISRYLCKLYIRNDCREKVLQRLRKMNVHHASLFPDLHGASQHCNRIVAEEEADYEVQIVTAELINRLDRSDKASAVNHTESFVEKVDQQELQTVEEVLSSSLAGVSVEPARLNILASHLVAEVRPYLVVDWQVRDSALAKVKNVIRVTLRRYGYPSGARDAAVDGIIELLKGG